MRGMVRIRWCLCWWFIVVTYSLFGTAAAVFALCWAWSGRRRTASLDHVGAAHIRILNYFVRR